jgi:hypothetical protein
MPKSMAITNSGREPLSDMMVIEKDWKLKWKKKVWIRGIRKVDMYEGYGGIGKAAFADRKWRYHSRTGLFGLGILEQKCGHLLRSILKGWNSMPLAYRDLWRVVANKWLTLPPSIYKGFRLLNVQSDRLGAKKRRLLHSNLFWER